LPQLMIGFHVPMLNADLDEESAWEPYALEVLAGILDGGDGARLSSQLVRGDEIAAAASADYRFAQRAAGLFTLGGTPARDRDVAELEEALLAQIDALRNAPVTTQELERVKRQVVAAEVYQRDSVFYQAMQIGLYETIGLDWRRLDEYVPGVRAITAEQVQTVARKYLTRDRMTLARLDPLPMDDSTTAQGAGEVSHVR
ncbi:MAG: insulinase family protein, partial [Pseudomonadota bacterium]|nr:insulinase family protein [Pseudomonadota bacterium]